MIRASQYRSLREDRAVPYTIDQDPKDDDAAKDLPATPYGPQPRGTDP